MESVDFKSLYESYLGVYGREVEEEVEVDEVKEGYSEPKFNKKEYLAKLAKRGGMGMGTKDDPHGYRDPKMAKVGAEFSKRKTAESKSKRTGEPDEYKAERKSKSKLSTTNESTDLYDLVLEYLLDEGLCESVENAEIMMAHMSESWVESIVEGVADKKVPQEQRSNLRNARAGFQVIDPKSPRATEVRRREHKERRGSRGNIGGEGASTYRYEDNANSDYPSFRVKGKGRS